MAKKWAWNRGVLLLLAVTMRFGQSEDDLMVAEECVDSEHELSFGCPDSDLELVIWQAWIYDPIMKASFDDRCVIPSYNAQYKKGSFLQHINRKCAGQQACHFSAWRDVPGARDNEALWSGGVIRTLYECVNKTSFNKVCASEVYAQEGWLRSVVYPQYYLGPGACTITVKVDEGQKIVLTITDLQVREIKQPDEKECTDVLEVTENKMELLRKCGGNSLPITVHSKGREINVTLHSSLELYPGRGYLAHFKAIGCQTPSNPENAELLYRNQTHSIFECFPRYVFPQDLQKTRIVRCLKGDLWNEELPRCASLDTLLAEGKITEGQYQWLQNRTAMAYHLYLIGETDFVYDLMVPAVLMAFLVLGNIVVVSLIIYCRKRIKEETESIDEVDSIKANADQPPTTKPEPCSV